MGDGLSVRDFAQLAIRYAQMPFGADAALVVSISSEACPDCARLTAAIIFEGLRQCGFLLERLTYREWRKRLAINTSAADGLMPHLPVERPPLLLEAVSTPAMACKFLREAQVAALAAFLREQHRLPPRASSGNIA